MNYQYPYAPNANPPPGMPAGYPYGPPPVPTSNPLLPPSAPGYPCMPDAPGYPSANPSYPSSTSPYPSANPGYPSSNSPYPSTSPAYPRSSSPSSNSPYPSTNPAYPRSSSPSYPSAFPPSANTPYPSASPSSGNPYPAPNSSYPSSYPGMYSGSPASNPSPYPTSSPSYPAAAPQGGPMGGRPGYSPYSSGSSAVNQGSYTGRLNMAQWGMYQGTVTPYPDFDPKKDAEVLRKAMKGFGTDEKAIIEVLAKRSNEQRIYIAVAFKQLYGKDLIDDLKSELRGNFEDVVIALMTPTNDYLAKEVHKSISGIGTDEGVLIEVLCTRTNQEIWGINESYRRLYGKSMEDDIKSDTSGHFERLLVSTCTGARSEAPADQSRATQSAHALYAAGVGKWGTDESVFNSILVAESFQQLASTFYEYQKLAGHTVAEAIKKELSGDLEKGMLAIAACVENRPLYFADRLYKAMKGLGTDDRTLIRIVVSRCEIDMVQIKAEYERTYGKSLADAIHGDTSGDYRRVLIALVNGY